jgi:uncharacterized damage-inducible protein DinB
MTPNQFSTTKTLTMQQNQVLIQELRVESKGTRKMLERIPEASFGWKPHPNSMSLGQLASHVAETPFWIVAILTQGEFDFESGHYTPSNITSHEELMKFFDYNLNMAIEEIEKAEDDMFSVPWNLRSGETVFFTLPRAAAIRTLAMNHLIHHRGQLSVYLRLLNIPVPGVYGPSYDEQKFMSTESATA